MLFVCGAACGVDRVEELQKSFDKDTHAGSKIKTLEKLSNAQFDVTRKAGAAGDFNTVGFTFEKYRDNVRACFDLLKKQEPDADKHSGDYRRLELQTRRGIRELEDALLTAPPEVHPPLEIVHKDIVDMDDELIRLLFPKRTTEPVKVPPAPEAKP
ncbi:MAG TPA: hypothetical protein VMH20_13095 [Verrucomicrobiae bacterium]|nr:hypothetical protein [Verrucomicrobiae bacterium]